MDNEQQEKKANVDTKGVDSIPWAFRHAHWLGQDNFGHHGQFAFHWSNSAVRTDSAGKQRS